MGYLQDAGGYISDKVKDIGGAVGDLNPLHASQSKYQATAAQNNYQVQPIPQATAAQNAFQANAPSFDRMGYASAIRDQMTQSGAPNMATSNAAGANQGSFANALAARSGTTDAQQQALVGQLQQEAAGNGPGAQLAKAQLAQATQSNIKQGAGMIASTKGLNPALAARMAADQTASANQAAAGQGAQLGMQAQLAGRGQLADVLGQRAALQTGTAANLMTAGRGQDIQSELGAQELTNQRYGQNLGALGQQNQLLAQGQEFAQGLNAQTAAENTQNQMTAQGMNINSNLSGQQLSAGIAGQNAQNQMTAQGINAGVAAQNAANKNAITTGVLGGVMNVAGAGVGGYATGLGQSAGKGKAHGGRIAGKADVPGDSPKNDKVPIMASPGEIVVPRSAADDPGKAKRFIDALMAKEGKMKVTGYGGVLQAKRELADLKKRMGALEQKIGRAG